MEGSSDEGREEGLLTQSSNLFPHSLQVLLHEYDIPWEPFSEQVLCLPFLPPSLSPSLLLYISPRSLPPSLHSLGHGLPSSFRLEHDALEHPKPKSLAKYSHHEHRPSLPPSLPPSPGHGLPSSFRLEHDAREHPRPKRFERHPCHEH